MSGQIDKMDMLRRVLRGRLAGWFAVIGVLNSAVGAYYYLKVLKIMFIDASDTPEPSTPLTMQPVYAGLLFLLVVPNIIGLLLWGYLDRVTEYSQKLLDVM